MKKKLLTLGIAAVIGLAGYISLFFIDNSNQSTRYGVSFDPDYARYINKDAGKAYLTTINDWGFKLVRLPVHWDVIEKNRGTYDFSDIDWYVRKAENNGVKLILSIGQKTPRWPECHVPGWSKEMDKEVYQKEVREYLTAAVEHYKNSPALEMWQVENEPFLHFGICPAVTVDDLRNEIALVRQLDGAHPVLVGDSGELSSWWVTGTAGDYFGTTVYRLVYNKVIGYFQYNFIPPVFYRLKLWLAGREVSKAFLLELQAEPWLTDKPFAETTLDEQYVSMDLNRLKQNVLYGQQIGLSRVYLWGAEWWGWLEEHEIRDIGQYVKTLPK